MTGIGVETMDILIFPKSSVFHHCTVIEFELLWFVAVIVATATASATASTTFKESGTKHFEHEPQ